VKFYGALRHPESAPDFLVAQTLKHAIENFLLSSADFHSGSNGTSGSKKLFGALGHSLQKRLPRHDHHFEIFRRLSPHQAMHGQQACNLLDRHTAIRFRLHPKSYSA